MHKIREILRLHLAAKQQLRAIGLSVGASPSTVHKHIARANEVGLVDWNAISALSDGELRLMLFPQGNRSTTTGYAREPVDLGYVHTELRRTGVTLLLLWQEYVQRTENGQLKPYSYSQYCDLYSEYRKSLRRSMRQIHRAGERCFIDYSGKKPTIVDAKTGEVRMVELFVIVLGASNYTYAEASFTQELPNFCMSVIRGLEFFRGVPEVLVPDQLRSAVRGPCRYDPDTNRTFHELAVHYGTTVLPARPRKPKDKAKVETAVLIAQRWIIAKIRNETFYSLGELNVRISQLVTELNDKKFQKLDGTRRSLFESLDRPALKPLPERRLDLGDWKKGKVHIDGHVALNERFYSAPSRYIGESVEVRSTPSLVEIYADGERIASHARSYGPKGTMISVLEHLPSSHQAMNGLSPERMIAWGATHGTAVGQAVERLLNTYPRPEFGFRPALGIIRLAERYGSGALNSACIQALKLSKTAPRRRLLEALLKAEKGVDSRMQSTRTLGMHEHIRGADYFVTEQPSLKKPEDMH